jgi:hypothetical protein
MPKTFAILVIIILVENTQHARNYYKNIIVVISAQLN